MPSKVDVSENSAIAVAAAKKARLDAGDPPPPTPSREDERERRKFEAEVRVFRRMELEAERKRVRQEQREQQRAQDPCKCGRSRTPGRLPKPLTLGGPRCNRCVPTPMPAAGSVGAPELPDAPILYPTEEEFRDPLGYIRSVQAQIYTYGIAVIQPPAAWRGPWSPDAPDPAPDPAPQGAVPSGGAAGARRSSGLAPAPAPLSLRRKASAEPSAAAGGAGGAGGSSARAPAPRQSREARDTELLPLEPSKKVLSARLQTVRRRETVSVPRGRADGAGTSAAPTLLAPFGLWVTPAYRCQHSLRDVRRFDQLMRAEAFPDHCEAEAAEADASDEPVAATEVPPELVEHFFWNSLACAEEANVLYWSDVPGTAFRDDERSPWSLARVARLRGSMLRHVRYVIPGVNDPMLYIGMLFSMFCWHTEDNYMYSLSYLHAGAAKTWYGLSATQAHAYEAAFCRHAFPTHVGKDPGMAFKKSSMVSPAFLAAHGVLPCRAVQRPGQFVVTLPQAYHAGFSHGFTVAEAVNFATVDWVPYALASIERCRLFRSESVLDLEHILLEAVTRDAPEPEQPEPSGGAAKKEGALVPDARRARQRRLARPWGRARGALLESMSAELEDRRRLRSDGDAPPLQLRPMASAERARALGRGPPCCVCAHVCHLSFVRCAGCEDELHARAAGAHACAQPPPHGAAGAPAASPAAAPAAEQSSAAAAAALLDGLPVCCLAHAHDSSLCERHAPTERALVTRYADETLNEVLRMLAPAHATGGGAASAKKPAASGGRSGRPAAPTKAAALEADQPLLPLPSPDPWLSQAERPQWGLPAPIHLSALAPPEEGSSLPSPDAPAAPEQNKQQASQAKRARAS